MKLRHASPSLFPTRRTRRSVENVTNEHVRRLKTSRRSMCSSRGPFLFVGPPARLLCRSRPVRPVLRGRPMVVARGRDSILDTTAGVRFPRVSTSISVPALACPLRTYPMAMFSPSTGEKPPLVTWPTSSSPTKILLPPRAGAPFPVKRKPTWRRHAASASCFLMVSPPTKSHASRRDLPIVHVRPASSGVMVSSRSLP